MRLLQFSLLNDESQQLNVGILEGNDTIKSLKISGNAKDFITQFNELSDAAIQFLMEGASVYHLEEVRLLPPLTDPEKIICIGLNYYDHVLESNMQVPKVPVLFPKFNNCLAGHGDEVVIPQEVSQCDYEVELAVVIGKTARKVSKDSAMDYVFGYTVLNDISARDIQLSEAQWTRGKAIDGFAPMGPWIVSKDEIPNRNFVSVKRHGHAELKYEGIDFRYSSFDFVPFKHHNIATGGHHQHRNAAGSRNGEEAAGMASARGRCGGIR